MVLEIDSCGSAADPMRGSYTMRRTSMNYFYRYVNSCVQLFWIGPSSSYGYIQYGESKRD